MRASKPSVDAASPGGIFQEFKNEVAIADKFLPKHNVAEKGLRLVDGHQPGRACLEDEEEATPSLGAADELEEEELDWGELDETTV